MVFYHLSLLPNPDLVIPAWARPVLGLGGMGVTLFFMVSAFSLNYTMPLRLAARRPLVDFWIHRFFRIAPLFYVMVLVYSVKDVFVYDVVHTPLEYLTNATFTFNLIPGMEQGFVWASWTIGVEMIFYALFPMFYLWTRSWQRALGLWLVSLLGWTAAGGIAARLMGAESLEQFSHWSFLRHLPMFLAGSAVYLAFVRWASARRGPDSADTGLLLLVTAVVGYVGVTSSRIPVVVGEAYHLQAIFFAPLILGLALNPIFLLVNRVTEYLGRISYSIYLIHPLVIWGLSRIYPRIVETSSRPTVTYFLCALLTFAVLIPLAELSYRIVEAPGVRLGKRVSRRWGRPGGPPGGEPRSIPTEPDPVATPSGVLVGGVSPG